MKNIVITGPTCTGKTRAAITLSEKISGEVISADSRQVYRHMDIGTAKPSMAERERVPHHLIDILNPDERYTAADFRRDAEIKINEINAKGKTPVIAGGTGLYIKALVDGIFEGPGSDSALRAGLEERAAKEGLENLYSELRSLDPASAAKIHPNDKRRIIRALEIYRLAGKPASSLRKWTVPAGEFAMFGLDMPREDLYAAVNERVERMFDNGFIDEVKNLMEKGYGENLVAMEAVGYREIISYLKGNSSLKDAAAQIMAATRGYARRQLTWFRKDKRIIWLTVSRNPDWDAVYSTIIKLTD